MPALLGGICHSGASETSLHLVPPRMGGLRFAAGTGRAAGGAHETNLCRRVGGNAEVDLAGPEVRFSLLLGRRFDTDTGRRLGYAPAELQGTSRVRLKFVSLCRIKTYLRSRRPQPGRTSRGAAPR